MKGLVVHMVKLFLSWVAVVAAVVAGLHFATGSAPIAGLGAALFAGSFGWIGTACLLVAFRSLRERGAIRRGMSDAPPQDGPTVLIGHIDSARPLNAPFDGRECVAYTYQIWREVRVGRTMSRFVLYKGIGLAPSQIATPAGAFRLLAVPTIEGAEPSEIPTEAGRRRIRSYLDETSFTPQSASHKELEARWSDGDGSYRSDVSAAENRPGASDPAVDLVTCSFEQFIVPRGAQVCVIGHYSAAERALVVDSNWARVTRLLLGDPAEASRKLAARARLQFVLGALLTLAAAGILTAFTSR